MSKFLRIQDTDESYEMKLVPWNFRWFIKSIPLASDACRLHRWWLKGAWDENNNNKKRSGHGQLSVCRVVYTFRHSMSSQRVVGCIGLNWLAYPTQDAIRLLFFFILVSLQREFWTKHAWGTRVSSALQQNNPRNYSDKTASLSHYNWGSMAEDVPAVVQIALQT